MAGGGGERQGTSDGSENKSPTRPNAPQSSSAAHLTAGAF
jgi:hypothetical protein